MVTKFTYLRSEDRCLEGAFVYSTGRSAPFSLQAAPIGLEIQAPELNVKMIVFKALNFKSNMSISEHEILK